MRKMVIMATVCLGRVGDDGSTATCALSKVSTELPCSFGKDCRATRVQYQM